MLIQEKNLAGIYVCVILICPHLQTLSNYPLSPISLSLLKRVSKFTLNGTLKVHEVNFKLLTPQHNIVTALLIFGQGVEGNYETGLTMDLFRRFNLPGLFHKPQLLFFYWSRVKKYVQPLKVPIAGVPAVDYTPNNIE